MNLPSITLSVHRGAPEFYTWALSMDIADGVLDQEDGRSSIEECLYRASKSLPNEAKTVAVRYQDAAVGRFTGIEIRHVPDVVADRIMETFSAFMDGRA